jgi:Uma2 family endonuclease
MMSGASNYHDVIAVSIGGHLFNRLQGKRCRLATVAAAVKTRINSYRRLDAAVTCDDSKPDSYEAQAPRPIVEVLSGWSSGVLWQRKLEEYRRRDGLVYIRLVDSELTWATVLTRKDAEWKPTDHDRMGDMIEFPQIECRLTMVQIYERLDLPEPTPGQR